MLGDRGGQDAVGGAVGLVRDHRRPLAAVRRLAAGARYERLPVGHRTHRSGVGAVTQQLQALEGGVVRKRRERDREVKLDTVQNRRRS